MVCLRGIRTSSSSSVPKKERRRRKISFSFVFFFFFFFIFVPTLYINRGRRRKNLKAILVCARSAFYIINDDAKRAAIHKITRARK